MSIKIFHEISKAVYTNRYETLGLVTIDDISTMKTIILNVIPHDGFHKDIQYNITLKYHDDNSWPYLYIDSDIFNQIKTLRYINNKGKNGDHKGICIKNLSNGYSFHKYFNQYCDNKWEIYIY